MVVFLTHAPAYPSMFSVAGVMVSIIASQAEDPSSTAKCFFYNRLTNCSFAIAVDNYIIHYTPPYSLDQNFRPFNLI